MKSYISMALVALTFLLAPDLSSQSIILVNGEPTEVILDGDAIKSIVKSQIEDYMKEFGHDTEEDFEQSDLRFEAEKNQSEPSEEQSSTNKNILINDYALSTDRSKELDKFK